MVVVDTNILLYALDQDFEEYPVCRKLLTDLREAGEPWYLTWGIIYEFLRIATHPKVLRKPRTIAQAWRYIDALISSDNLILLTQTPRHASISNELFKDLPDLSGNLLFDASTAILMREHGLRRIYTRDKHFELFDFIDAVNPID